jgi:hypothetical protein
VVEYPPSSKVSRRCKSRRAEFICPGPSSETPTAGFEEVLRRQPDHAAARSYLERARERHDMDGDATENAASWPQYGLSALAGVLLIGALSVGWSWLRSGGRRRR